MNVWRCALSTVLGRCCLPDRATARHPLCAAYLPGLLRAVGAAPGSAPRRREIAHRRPCAHRIASEP